MLIDFHTHAFPEKIAAKAIGSLEASSSTKAAIEGTYPALLESMERNGVDFSVVLPIVTRPAQTKSILHFAGELQKIPGLIPFGSVHPLSEDVKGDIRAIKRLGLRGVKFHPDFQDVFLDDIETIRAMSLAAEEDLPIVIHAGEDISYPHVHHSTPKRLLNVLKELKGATIVCAHTGGWRYWDDVEALLMDQDLYIDTSYTYGWCQKEQMARIIRSWDPDKVLFGTDSPWVNQGEAVRQLRELDLPAALYDKIFYKNALRLLGMKE